MYRNMSIVLLINASDLQEAYHRPELILVLKLRSLFYIMITGELYNSLWLMHTLSYMINLFHDQKLFIKIQRSASREPLSSCRPLLVRRM